MLYQKQTKTRKSYLRLGADYFPRRLVDLCGPLLLGRLASPFGQWHVSFGLMLLLSQAVPGGHREFGLAPNGGGWDLICLMGPWCGADGPLCLMRDALQTA